MRGKHFEYCFQGSYFLPSIGQWWLFVSHISFASLLSLRQKKAHGKGDREAGDHDPSTCCTEYTLMILWANLSFEKDNFLRVLQESQPVRLQSQDKLALQLCGVPRCLAPQLSLLLPHSTDLWEPTAGKPAVQPQQHIWAITIVQTPQSPWGSGLSWLLLLCLKL